MSLITRSILAKVLFATYTMQFNKQLIMALATQNLLLKPFDLKIPGQIPLLPPIEIQVHRYYVQ